MLALRPCAPRFQEDNKSKSTHCGHELQLLGSQQLGKAEAKQKQEWEARTLGPAPADPDSPHSGSYWWQAEGVARKVPLASEEELFNHRIERAGGGTGRGLLLHRKISRCLGRRFVDV